MIMYFQNFVHSYHMYVHISDDNNFVHYSYFHTLHPGIPWTVQGFGHLCICLEIWKFTSLQLGLHDILVYNWKQCCGSQLIAPMAAMENLQECMVIASTTQLPVEGIQGMLFVTSEFSIAAGGVKTALSQSLGHSEQPKTNTSSDTNTASNLSREIWIIAREFHFQRLAGN